MTYQTGDRVELETTKITDGNARTWTVLGTILGQIGIGLGGGDPVYSIERDDGERQIASESNIRRAR